LALEEEQDIVYRGAEGMRGEPARARTTGRGRATTVRPDAVMLFRYSALTGNGTHP
jgi:3-methylfumaryl-CoA hydratase